MFEFLDFDYLTDGEIDLIIEQKLPANDEKGYVPAYEYRITLHGYHDPIGRIGIRIGYNENIWYGGNIGYFINEEYRGNQYAAKACKLVKQVAKAHGMSKLIITCNPDNLPSRKTCESVDAVLKEIVGLPSHNEQYQEGERQKCIYEWIIGFCPIYTDRLILRDFTHADFSSVHEYASDPETVQYMLWGPNTEQDTLNFLDRVIKYQGNNPRIVFELAVELREYQRLIGGCSINISNPVYREGELGYCFNKNYWGKGYATEASDALLKFGFHDLHLHRIYATCDPSNIGSARVLERIGMKREGHLREHLLQRGEWRDSYLYSILEHEFPVRRSNDYKQNIN